MIIAADSSDSMKGDEAQKELVTRYVAAVNAKDTGKLKELVHPKCLAAITDETRSFYDFIFLSEFKQTIPDGYKVRVNAVRQDQLDSMVGFATFPIQPTHTIQVEWFPTPNNTQARVIFAVQDGGKWFDVLPVPTAETLQRFRTKKETEQRPAQ